GAAVGVEHPRAGRLVGGRPGPAEQAAVQQQAGRRRGAGQEPVGDRALLGWCAANGLLGLLPHEVELAYLAPRWALAASDCGQLATAAPGPRTAAESPPSHRASACTGNLDRVPSDSPVRWR